MSWDINALFKAARENPANPMNRTGRLMGRHCRARLQRAKDKRVAAGKRAYVAK